MNKNSVDQIIKFICCLNKNQLKQANAVLLTLRNESFYTHLVEIYDLVTIMKESQKCIEEQNTTLNKQRQKIMKLQSLNLKQYYKSMNKHSENFQYLNKAEVFDYLTIGNYEKVKDLYKSHKLSKAPAFLQTLSEFIYFKPFIPIQGGHKIQQKKQELSKEGKLFKALFMKTNQFRKQINHKLSKALFSLFRSQIKQFEQQELPSAFFTSDTKRIFNNIVALIRNLKEVIDKSQQKEVQINKKFDNQLPVNQDNPFLLQRLAQLIKKYELKNIQPPSLNNGRNHNQSIFHCFKDLLQNLKTAEKIYQDTKQWLNNCAQKQQKVCSVLLELHKQLRIRIPSIPAPRERQDSWLLAKVFEADTNLFLEEFDKVKDKAERKQSISSVFVGEEQIRSTNNSINENSKQEKQFSGPQQQIQQLKNEIQSLSQQNKALQQKTSILGQENQEERKLVQRYTKQNQALVQKLKKYQISLQSIINTPFREYQDKDTGLVDENAALRAEITLLKKDISEKQGLVSNFEARVAEALRKRKAEHQKQIQKWRKKYAESNLQIDECHEQIQMLNKILEEKMLAKQQGEPNEKILYENKQQQQIKLQQQVYQDLITQTKAQKIKIQSLQQTVQKLIQLAAQKEKINNEARISQKIQLQKVQRELKKQNEQFEKQIKQLKAQNIVLQDRQNSCSSHLFPPGFIFDETDHEERMFLLRNLKSYLGSIKRTRLLFRADNYNKVNFHKYIDHERHIVLIARTIYGKLIAGYSQQPFSPQGINKGFGMILSLWAKKVFRVKDKKAISYDDYFAIFGNSQLRIRSLQLKLFSNFGIANSYYDNQGEKVHIILGEGAQREVDLLHYEFYALDLDQ